MDIEYNFHHYAYPGINNKRRIPIELEGTGFAFSEITAIKGLHENKTQCFEVERV